MEVLYFSGTGNSLHAARKIGKELGATSISRLDQNYMHKHHRLESPEILLVVPLYYLSIPLMVLDYLKSVDFSMVNNVHVVVTRGKTVGVVDKVVKRILGNRLKSLHYISMPANYIIQYDLANHEMVNKILAEAEQRFLWVANSINKKENVIERKWGIIKTMALPASIAYTKKLKTTDQNFRVTEACIGCGICEKICCINNITLRNNRPQWQGSCQECMGCIQQCPEQAIDYGKGISERSRYRHPEVSLAELLESNIPT